MSLYDGIKDVASIVQKADNIELYRQLIDLSAQALDMQDEIRRLKEENTDLQKDNELNNKIVRHKEGFLTLQGDLEGIEYCSTCWGYEHKLIQLYDGYCERCLERRHK